MSVKQSQEQAACGKTMTAYRMPHHGTPWMVQMDYQISTLRIGTRRPRGGEISARQPARLNSTDITSYRGE